jgi:hypothetical protein
MTVYIVFKERRPQYGDSEVEVVCATQELADQEVARVEKGGSQAFAMPYVVKGI